MKRWRVYGIIVLVIISTPVFAKEISFIPGITEAMHDVTLSLDTAGQIEKIHVNEGDFVTKEQILLSLYSLQEKLDVERRELIWKSKAKLDTAQERSSILKKNYESALTLFEKSKSVSIEEIRKLELEYKTILGEIERLKIAEQREKIEYDISQANLNNRILRSPINGVVIQKFLDIGEHCEQGQALFRLVDTRKCFFVGNIDEKTGQNLVNKQKVSLNIGSNHIQKTGTIVFISPVIDPASGLFEIKIQFNNKDRIIKPGVSGYLNLEFNDPLTSQLENNVKFHH
jgi:RND family efflux transporter MFP subunit